MLTRRRQSGMSILSILGLLIMLGFFAMCIIRMTPAYLEYLTVKKMIAEIANDPETATIPEIRKKIANLYNTNQIYLVKPESVKVFSKGGKTYINANYEVRLPVMWRIDSVMKFDDLFYEVGKRDPQPVVQPPTDGY
jgi:hypothetical protein